MEDAFNILLGEKSEKARVFFNKVSFDMEEFLITDESVLEARALALKCGFALFCSTYLENVTNFKSQNSFIDIYDNFNFHEFKEEYFYLFGKSNLIWQELDMLNEEEREEGRFEIMIEQLLKYYSEFWKQYLLQKFKSISPLMAADVVLDALSETETVSDEVEKSYNFFTFTNKNLSIEI